MLTEKLSRIFPLQLQKSICTSKGSLMHQAYNQHVLVVIWKFQMNKHSENPLNIKTVALSHNIRTSS